MTAKTMEQLGTKDVECEKHGRYISTGVRYFGTREVWTTCQDCKEEAVEAERLEAKAEVARQMEKRLEAVLEASCLPTRFVGRGFDEFHADLPQQKRVLEICKRYAGKFDELKTKGTSLVMLGKPGTGKSHLAGAILQAIMPTNTGLYLTSSQLIRAVRNSWRRDSERSEIEVMRELSSVGLLVIDEIGVQYGTDGERHILFEILDQRYREMMPTILMGNVSPAGLREILGERAFDRLYETATTIVFDWDSYRQQQRKVGA